MAEWSMAVVLKTTEPGRVPGVRIPLSPPLYSHSAVHLATALIWRDRMGPLPVMATHHTALGSAARAFGFEVVGA
jgi:hypothetical protein